MACVTSVATTKVFPKFVPIPQNAHNRNVHHKPLELKSKPQLWNRKSHAFSKHDTSRFRSNTPYAVSLENCKASVSSNWGSRMRFRCNDTTLPALENIYQIQYTFETESFTWKFLFLHIIFCQDFKHVQQRIFVCKTWGNCFFSVLPYKIVWETPEYTDVPNCKYISNSGIRREMTTVLNPPCSRELTTKSR